MGTRSLTVFTDEDDKEIAVLYRQSGGHPEAHGQDLLNFYKGKKLCNGIGTGCSLETYFNGMGCLTAATIAHFKKNIGNFYLHRARTRDVGEEYVYTVACDETGNIGVSCWDVYGKKLSFCYVGGKLAKA